MRCNTTQVITRAQMKSSSKHFYYYAKCFTYLLASNEYECNRLKNQSHFWKNFPCACAILL